LSFNTILLTIFKLQLPVIVVPIKSRDNKTKSYSTYSLQNPEQETDEQVAKHLDLIVLKQ